LILEYVAGMGHQTHVNLFMKRATRALSNDKMLELRYFVDISVKKSQDCSIISNAAITITTSTTSNQKTTTTTTTTVTPTTATITSATNTTTITTNSTTITTSTTSN